MATKKGGFNDLIDIASKLPWWSSLCFALGGYLVFHHYSEVDIPFALSPSMISDIAREQFVKSVSTFLQYVIPAAFIIGAVVSLMEGKKSSKLDEQVKPGSTQEEIANLSWQEFEAFIGEAFRRQGFKVVEGGDPEPDSGKDLVMSKANEKYLVRCKHYRAQKVGTSLVSELYGVMEAEGAARGYIVTSGQFTRPALKWSIGKNIQLIDGVVLERWYSRKRHKLADKQPLLNQKVCPARCGEDKVKQSGKQKVYAGSKF